MSWDEAKRVLETLRDRLAATGLTADVAGHWAEELGRVLRMIDYDAESPPSVAPASDEPPAGEQPPVPTQEPPQPPETTAAPESSPQQVGQSPSPSDSPAGAAGAAPVGAHPVAETADGSSTPSAVSPPSFADGGISRFPPPQ